MSTLILGPLVGGLSHNRANLWGRADGPGVLHAWLTTHADGSDLRLVGKTELPEADGYAGMVALEGLQPETTYYYALTLEDTPPAPASLRPFTTFPLPGEPRSFAFAFGSCFRPGEAGGEAFRVLAERIARDRLRFALLIGDQIYADDWEYNGLGRVAVSKDDYRRVYAHVWSNPAWRETLSRLPVFMTLDDHEVDNDWHWLDAERRWAEIPWYTYLERRLKGRPPQECHLPLHRVRDALKVYWEHQGMHAPLPLSPLTLNEARQFRLYRQDEGSLAYAFTFGAAAFFVMDTRTGRILNRRERKMLSEGQWRDLENWLLAVKDVYPVKFLVTSSALLYDLFPDVGDRWSAFRQERERLLHFLAANGIEGVYFLAGDLHAAHATEAELYGPQGKRLRLQEFCSTPFEQEPNWLVRFLKIRPRSSAIARFRAYFTVIAWNFGVVQVDFSTTPPRVTFECVFRASNGCWSSWFLDGEHAWKADG